MYRGAVVLVDELAPFALGEQRGVVVRVANGDTHVWPPGGVGWPEIRVSYRWLDIAGTVVVKDGLRTPLPAVLPPGRSAIVPADVLAPPSPGRHTLVLDLLHEHVRWFGCETSVEVRPALCLAILGEDEQAATAAAAALAEIAPSVRPLLLSASPGRTTDLYGYRAGPDARAYVLDRGAGGMVRATAGALARAAALLGDAALLRAGARSRLAAPRGTAYLDALSCADALLVVGGNVLRGERGPREALQARAAVLAARTLGLETAVVTRAPEGLAAELTEVVRRLEARGT